LAEACFKKVNRFSRPVETSPRREWNTDPEHTPEKYKKKRIARKRRKENKKKKRLEKHLEAQKEWEEKQRLWKARKEWRRIRYLTFPMKCINKRNKPYKLEIMDFWALDNSYQKERRSEKIFRDKRKGSGRKQPFKHPKVKGRKLKSKAKGYVGRGKYEALKLVKTMAW